MRSFRKLANKVIDAAFIAQSLARLQPSVVILHGASCSGKSFILRHLGRKYTGCTYLEMYKFHYWKPQPGADILKDADERIANTSMEPDQLRALFRCIKHSHRVPEHASRHEVMVELLKTCLASDAIIATCGNLPPPFVDNGYYELLGRSTGKIILHVLVAPDDATHARRIQARGRQALTEKYLTDNNWWLQHAKSYDLLFTGDESTSRILELIRESIASIGTSIRTEVSPTVTT